MSLQQFQTVETGIRLVAERMPEMSVPQSLAIRTLTLLGRELSSRMDQWMRPFGLTEPEFRVLIWLFARGEQATHAGDLGTHLAQSPANVTRLCDALVERGLITRAPSDEDRRRMLMRITATGEAMVREMLPSMAAFLRDLFTEFTPADLERMISDLRRLATALDRLTQYTPAEVGA